LLYGFPNYRWPRWYVVIPWRPVSYSLLRRWIVWPLASGVQTMSTVAETATITKTVTLEITDWYTDFSGLVNIPGASYVGNYDYDDNESEPILPVVHTSHVLPQEAPAPHHLPTAQAVQERSLGRTAY
jgi:hypothetical protein